MTVWLGPCSAHEGRDAPAGLPADRGEPAGRRWRAGWRRRWPSPSPASSTPSPGRSRRWWRWSGQAVIRHTPGFLSRGATESVGTADKPLLLALIVVLALGIGARVGVAARRRPRVGDVAFAAFALFGGGLRRVAEPCLGRRDPGGRHRRRGASGPSPSAASSPSPRPRAGDTPRRPVPRPSPRPRRRGVAGGAHRQPAPVPGGGVDRGGGAAVLLGGAWGLRRATGPLQTRRRRSSCPPPWRPARHCGLGGAAEASRRWRASPRSSPRTATSTGSTRP